MKKDSCLPSLSFNVLFVFFSFTPFSIAIGFDVFNTIRNIVERSSLISTIPISAYHGDIVVMTMVFLIIVVPIGIMEEIGKKIRCEVFTPILAIPLALFALIITAIVTSGNPDIIMFVTLISYLLFCWMISKLSSKEKRKFTGQEQESILDYPIN